MPYTQIWVLPNLSTQPHPAALEPIHNTYVPPFSVAYFCPFRGEVWGRRICMDDEGNTTRWHIYVAPHPAEPPRNFTFYPQGTILHCIPEKVWPTLPPSILAREFMLYAENGWLDKLKTMGND